MLAVMQCPNPSSLKAASVLVTRHGAPSWRPARRLHHAARRPRASAAEDQPAPSPLLNEQFMGVLSQSLARQGADALVLCPSPAEEPRVSAVEEVLSNALNQSKQSLRWLNQLRLQIDAQIAAQEKQVERMEFALHKASTDAAYMKALKSMAFNTEE